MKILKQILIFAAFTAVIFGIFTIVTHQKQDLNPESLAAANHEQILKEIDSGWSGVSDWDQEMYDRQMTKVAQSQSAGVINDIDSKTLKDRINKSAYSKCVDAMDREFARADCDDAKLALNFDGLQVVQMNEPGLASNDRIIEINKVYNLYKRVLAFNDRSFNLSPNYNGSSSRWNSWTGHQDRIVKQQNELLGDSRFPRIKEITKVKKIYETGKKINDSRQKFYDNLNSEISTYFNSEISQYQNMAANDNRDEATCRQHKTGMIDAIANTRIHVTNDEKYLPGSHVIHENLRRLTRTISSL